MPLIGTFALRAPVQFAPCGGPAALIAGGLLEIGQPSGLVAGLLHQIVDLGGHRVERIADVFSPIIAWFSRNSRIDTICGPSGTVYIIFAFGVLSATARAHRNSGVFMNDAS